MLLSSTIVVVIFHDEIYECSGRQHAFNGPFKTKQKHALNDIDFNNVKKIDIDLDNCLNW